MTDIATAYRTPGRGRMIVLAGIRLIPVRVAIVCSAICLSAASARGADELVTADVAISASEPVIASEPSIAGEPVIAGEPILAGQPLSTAQAGPTFTVKVTPDLVYARTDDVELRCDVYSPVPPAGSDEVIPARRPVVLLIHGGAWSSGSRRTMGGYATRLARCGIVGVSIDYRLAPQWKFPAQVDDVRRAMCWLASEQDSLGIDPDRMGLFGYSAGGHLACMIGTLADEPIETRAATSNWDPQDPRLTDLVQPIAVCAGGPPCDFTGIPQASGGLAYFLGGSPAEVPGVYALASPVTHASAGDTPTLFIHGERDAIVPMSSSRVLFDAQRKSGVQSEFVLIEKRGHMFTFIDPKTSESMIAFFRQRLFAADR
jgi:acetyl esterase/lipase